MPMDLYTKHNVGISIDSTELYASICSNYNSKSTVHNDIESNIKYRFHALRFLLPNKNVLFVSMFHIIPTKTI